MNYQAKAFLESYPLTQEGQEIIDKANNGDIVPLVRMLTGCVTAISKLRTRTTNKPPSAALGLMNYYRGQINALVECIKDPSVKKPLTKIFIGD
jgi:hypothetical protein